MCGPMLGGLMGAALFEGWATDEADALEQLRDGQIEVAPCHHHGAVGPMAGVLAPSMPVVVVTDQGRAAFASLNEGLGKVLRFGAYDQEVLTRLAWMRDVLGPVLDSALSDTGPMNVAQHGPPSADDGRRRARTATSPRPACSPGGWRPRSQPPRTVWRS